MIHIIYMAAGNSRRFGSNIRAGAEYREIICRVLTRRAVTQSLDICDDIKHEH